MFFACIGSLYAQSNTVTGIVTYATDGEPLIGISVIVKGTTTGTITDIDGAYSINVSKGQTLVFSCIGMQTVEMVVGASAIINVTMEDDSVLLDEVVAVGYGVQKKKLVTGATDQVKGDAILKQNTTSPLQAMQGMTAGVNISSTSGQPGSDMKVTIRGLGTVGSSQPLYIIDGVGGDISTLNPADIESIDVLKDAASAAIYGAQAANGVVLITTKSGKAGKAEVSFDAYYGVQNVARKAKLLNAQQYMTIMDEQAVNSGSAPYDWGSFSSIWNADGSVIDTDWLGTMFKDDATIQSYSLGVTGGNDVSTFAVSIGYMQQEGIVGGKDASNYERYNFRVNSDHKVIKNLLKIGEQVSFVYNKTRGVNVGNQYNNTLRGAFGTSPLSPVYSDNNIFGSPYNDTSNSDWYNADGNPYGSMMTTTNNQTKAATFSGNVYAELTPIKGLKIRTLFGAVYYSDDYRSYKPLYQFSIYDLNTNNTSVTQSHNQGLTLTWTNTAQYDWDVKDHSFTAMIGMEASRYSGVYVGASNGILKDGYDDWSHAYVDNASGNTQEEGLSASGSPNDQTRTVSYFARIGWNWKERYVVNATFRADGSSKFARGHRYGFFPSASAGWNITSEKFMESASRWLSFLRLRFSWGLVGNQNIDNYQYEAPVTSSNTNYIFGTELGSANNVWGAYPSRLANENVKWETSEQYDVGIDARFFSGRLVFAGDFYIKNTKDWLVQAPILATAGADAPYINGGNVKNTGVELSLTWNATAGREFNYYVGVNGAWNKNRVGKIPTEDGIIHGSTNQLYDNTPEFYRAENGHAIGYFWGYKTAGIFQNEQEIADWIAAGNGVLQSSVQPGDVKYYDINHDGVIDDNDKVDLGNGMPDFTYGFNLGFEWKGLDFSVTAYGSVGNDIVQSYRGHSNKQANYTTAILGRWTGEGTSNKIPRVTETNVNWQFSDLFVHDGDFLRISNITVGYDFARLWKYKACPQARLYVQVQNPFTFTKYDGMDPEIGYGTEGSGANSWVTGIDLGYYPRPRTVLIGVNLKF
ncbi:MAG: TonB-dependent receptor [Bacteroidales bacterium]|nr:TonB-dependent receptor [Bacteroidales bacterium]